MYALMREYPIYTCTVCGCRQRSDNKVQCEDEFLDIGEMVVAAHRLATHTPPFAMSTHWSSLGNNQYKCPRCQRENSVLP